MECEHNENKIQNFFFLFFFNFLIIPFSFVTAIEITEPVLGVDILAVNTGNFRDGTPGDTIRILKSSIGGKDLIAFENKGMISYDEATKTAIYGGIITFGVETNAYTAVLVGDAYPTSGGTNFNKITERMFLSYQIWKHMNLLGLPCSNILSVAFGSKQTDSKSFSINYREMEYGKLYSHNYDGILPINVEVDTGIFLSKIGELVVAGQTFSVPKMTSDIKSVKEVSKRSGDVGGYADRFTGETDGEDDVTVNIEMKSTVFNFDEQKVNDWFNEKMKPVLTIGTPKPDRTVQSSVIDATLNSYDFAGIQDSIEIPYKVHLQPEIYKITQTVTLRYGTFHWWACCNKYRKTPVVVATDYKREVGFHVSNVFVHTDFEVRVEVAMSCQFDTKLSTSFLDDPNLIISDRVWGTTIYGDKDVDVQLPWSDIDWITIIIIIIVVIVIIYVVYRYLKRRKRGGKPINIYVGGSKAVK